MRSSSFGQSSVRRSRYVTASRHATLFTLTMALLAWAGSAGAGSQEATGNVRIATLADPPPQTDVIQGPSSDVIDADETSGSTTSGGGQANEPTIVSVTTQLRGDYLGEALPGETPVPFAPGALSSLSAWVEATVFSPDGTLLFLSVGSADYSSAKLYYSRRLNDTWTPFADAPFVSDFTYSNEPVFSADGATLTFTGRKATGSIDLWRVHRKDGEWGTPVALPAPINSAGKDHRGSSTSDGIMFFCSNRSGMMQVYKAHEEAGHEIVAELLGAPINVEAYDGDPCIAPDGRFLVFYSARDGRSAELLVSFRDGEGGWGPPINLGSAFNSPNDEYGAHLSSDGNFLFFTRHSPQGNTIYWVATAAIDKLKP